MGPHGQQVPGDFDAFVTAERPRLVAAMSLYLGDEGVAEEVVQEAFIRAASRWGRVGRLDSPGGWTYRVARNLATSRLRRRLTELRARPRVAESTVHVDPDHADRLAIQNALRSLPAPQREAIVLKYYLGLDGPAIASRTGRTPGAVRALIKRGVAGLREELGSALLDHEEVADAV